MSLQREDFSWHVADETMSSEASTLRFPPGKWPTFITIVNPGSCTRFGNPKPHRNEEGDLQYMDYFPRIHTPEAGKVRYVRIFND